MPKQSSTLQLQLQSSIREIVFGMEDSLVSTLGAVTGIAAGTGNAFVVILSGIVLIFVEALSMTAGSYLSSKSAHEVFEMRKKQNTSRLLQEKVRDNTTLHELLTRKKLSKRDVNDVMNAFQKEQDLFVKELQRCEARYAPGTSTTPVKAAGVMGFFYLSGGLFPVLPYFFLDVQAAILPSVVLTGVVLFGLGVFKAKVAQGVWWKSGLEMTSISLTAALLGFLIGRAVSLAFGISAV